MSTTLLISNDSPTGVGGIEVMVAAAIDALTTDGRRVVFQGSRGLLLPTPAAARAAVDAVRSHGADSVLFGAAAPLGLLARTLRPHVRTIVAMSHGHECGWARTPLARRALRRIGADVDALTTISAYTEQVIGSALRPQDRGKLARLTPPVDLSVFRPRDAAPRTERPVVLAAARLVGQKGVDVLLRAWEQVVAAWTGGPRPLLRIVGEGSQRSHLMRLAAPGVERGDVEFRAAVPHARMPDQMRAADVFALPVQSRWGGRHAEGFGLVFAEAGACGVPVIAGASGGVRDVVHHGVNGFVLDPTDPAVWADHLRRLLRDPELRTRMGTVGRRLAARFGREHFDLTLRAMFASHEPGRAS